MESRPITLACEHKRHELCVLFDRCRCDCHLGYPESKLAKQQRERARQLAACELEHYWSSESYSHAADLARR
jgi:hypothetical protein